MKLDAISRREASIFAAAADTLLAPEPRLPPVRETTAAGGFDEWLLRSPRLNRLGVRAGLHLLELAPLARYGRRFRALDRERRRAFLAPAGRRRPAWIATLVDLLRMLAAATYYSDDAVAGRLGYDAAARVARGRELRAAENRP